MQQGFFSVQQACPHCHGAGETISHPCSDCRGQGRRQESKKLSVKIPAGIDNGDRIRLTGEGEAGFNGGSSGDLYVQANIKPHTLFERHENDLLCELPISFVTAAIGGEIDVPTLDGRVKLKIPAETQSGKLFRLRGKGVKALRKNTVGDLLCRVVVETPVNLDKQQKELLQQLEESLHKGNKHYPKTTSWLDSIKKFFEHVKS